MISKSFVDKYYMILVSILPLSIILGSSISLLNVLLISIGFIYIALSKLDFSSFKNSITYGFLIIFTYLCFNSFISLQTEEGLLRNVGFVRFILLFFALNFFFFNTKNTSYIFKTWIIIILIVLGDCFYEIIFGKNILGFSLDQTYSEHGRIVSFFKDELIVVGFLNGFIFLVLGFLFINFDIKKKKNSLLIFLVLLSFLGFVILSGERSNSIKAIIGLFIFFMLNHHIKLKFKVLIVLSFLTVVALSFQTSSWIKYRYGDDLLFKLVDKDKRNNFINENIYFNLYRSGIEVYKKHPYFGVGNKNYRVISCELDSPLVCNTHPHQIYIELLAEHGSFGFILLLSILFYLIFKNLRIILISKNMLQIGAFCYLLITFIPILPGGSFFSDFNATLFWLNFSIFYASNPKTNIFNKITN
tara:strand:- start:641 stop:1888 length:1248 start_codon:yes stop_codon:yes gene_type:complete